MLGCLMWMGTIGACGGNAPPPVPPAQEPIANQAPPAPVAAPAPPAPTPAAADDDANPSAEQAIARMAAFRDAMCKCTTKQCAEDVVEALTKWGQRMAREAGAHAMPKITEDETRRMAEVTETMTRCMTTAMSSG